MTPNRFSQGARAATLVVLAVLATGCSRLQDIRNPQTSPLVIDGQSVPEVARISIPMPEPEPYVRPQRAEASSLWSTSTRSFFGDSRAERVGDILTVIIEIEDEADLSNESERSRSATQTAGSPTFFGYGGKIDRILPGISENDLPAGDIVDLGSSSGTSGEGSIRRNEKISLRVAATIIETLPNDNLVIAGRQEIKVNSELRELRIAGVVRPVDISLRNTISYDQIAEARVAYGGRGQISAVQQPRYGQDALEVILPY
ncbi:flagellar basal body L-ring protein FlgH [Aestuariivita sp.]|uniref:flagellar basal body L-ring protein FlgH n=1 Tax=Aestuariivita sp. TaxID=1872407 RepID=UPI0021707C34|nr:flagellar basal body L-ring protein FlgH [Aestuariivita sp.]MCE8008959.1 flagellar basal body L-ring protein FlgH [Aestuariivita sp.]